MTEIGSSEVSTLVDLSEFDLDPAIASDGTVVFESSPNGFAQLHTVPLSGREPKPISEVLDGWATYPTWSPNGDEIAYACGRPNPEASDICVITARGKLRGSTEPMSQSQEIEPSWSPDDSSIAFSSDRSGDRDLYSVDLESFAVERLTGGPDTDGDPAYSPNGEEIAFTRSGIGDPMVCILDVHGGGVRCVTEGIQPSWSPDGKSFVFYRDTPGGSRIFTASSDGSSVEQITI